MLVQVHTLVKEKYEAIKNIPSYRPICLLNAMGCSLILLYWCRRKTETARLFGERFPEIGELEESDWEDNRVPHNVLSTALPKRTGGNIVNERHIFCHFLNTKEGEHPLKTAYGHLWALVREVERLGRKQLALVRLEGTKRCWSA
jgi:hypothetical protein